MGEVVYTSQIQLTRVRGPLRLAQLPAESEPVRFGTHGPIARHYGIHGEVPEAGADKVAAERAHETFKPKCPIYRSLHRAIDITTGLSLVAIAGA